jgi:hypothetical protein
LLLCSDIGRCCIVIESDKAKYASNQIVEHLKDKCSLFKNCNLSETELAVFTEKLQRDLERNNIRNKAKRRRQVVVEMTETETQPDGTTLERVRKKRRRDPHLPIAEGHLLNGKFAKGNQESFKRKVFGGPRAAIPVYSQEEYERVLRHQQVDTFQ